MKCFNIKHKVELFKSYYKPKETPTMATMQNDTSGSLKRKRQFLPDNIKESAVPLPTPLLQLGNDASISDFDILSIYTDVSKLGAIEEYLKLLYRPFSCFLSSGCSYELNELKYSLSNTCYDPQKHPALFMHISNPLCSLKVYDNGNICAQAYSYEGAAVGALYFIDKMKRMGYYPRFHHPKFNVVNATFCMPFGINLDQFYEEYRWKCQYTPEKQPYLMYKVQDSVIKLAIFPMGYVYVLLSSHPTNTQKAIANILPQLYRHRKMEQMTDEENVNVLSSGDINFKLLWENKFQQAYEDTFKYYMPKRATTTAT